MEKYDINTFTRYDLGPRPPEMALNVSDSGGFAFNSALQKKLPAHFCIYASQDKRVLCIKEATDITFTLPKSYRTQIPTLLQDIKSAGVLLPARYIFFIDDGNLIGELKQPDVQKSGRGKNKLDPGRTRKISKSIEEYLMGGISNGELLRER